MRRLPLTARQLELLAMSSIESQLPVGFKNGLTCTEISCTCNGCNGVVPQNKVRGSISTAFQGVAVLSAVGVCDSCKLVTEYSWRLHEDGRITGLTNQGWKTWFLKPSEANPIMAGIGRLLKWLRSGKAL